MTRSDYFWFPWRRRLSCVCRLLRLLLLLLMLLFSCVGISCLAPLANA